MATNLKYKFQGEKLSGTKVSAVFLSGFIKSLTKISKRIHELNESDTKDIDFKIELKDGSTEIEVSAFEEDLTGWNSVKKATEVIGNFFNESQDEKYTKDLIIRKEFVNLIKSTYEIADSLDIYSNSDKIGETIQLTETTVEAISIEVEEAPYITHVVKIHMANDRYNYVGLTIPGVTKSYEADIPVVYIKDFKRMFNDDNFVFVTIDTKTPTNRKKIIKYKEISEELPNDYGDLKVELDKKIKEISKFDELKENWDGYNAKQISKNLIINTIHYLKLVGSIINQLNMNQILPVVVPVPNGNIQFEWEVKDKYLEIEFNDKNKFDILKIENEGKTNQIEVEFSIDNMLMTLDPIYWILKK